MTVGAIVILVIDVPLHNTGLILAFGAGVYVQVGAAECLPRVYSAATTIKMKFLSLVAFVAGATCIGLVLLDDDHCSATEPTDEH